MGSIENHVLQLQELPQVADRRQIRLEISIDQAMEQLFASLPRRDRVTFETFLEAAFLACQEDQTLMNAVLKVAQERLLIRKKAGTVRRLKAQSKGS
jgi:hypothetical protein